jgi:hypothetical protein
MSGGVDRQCTCVRPLHQQSLVECEADLLGVIVSATPCKMYGFVQPLFRALPLPESSLSQGLGTQRVRQREVESITARKFEKVGSDDTPFGVAPREGERG